MSSGITRRQALKHLGAAAGAALVAPRLAGCGSSGPGEINTIVVVMMENRSYDHMFGARKLVDGLGGDGLVAGMQNPDLGGVQRPIHRAGLDCVDDPPHGWDPSHAQWNSGRNDGFVRQYQMAQPTAPPDAVMGYFQRQDLPVLNALADSSTSCDRWFASVMGPTWPNRYYLHAAQSYGIKTNVVQTVEFPTLYHRLDAAGVPWRYFYSDAPFLATMKGIDTSKWKRFDPDFFDAADAGTLPPVVMIDPGFTLNDYHPPHHPLLGEQFLSSVYNALAASPQWRNLLLVITFDEHGGFFDHVSPPTVPDDRKSQGFDQLGFRVPAIIAGPYVKRDYVSSTQHDHTSVLKHIEGMFALAPLTMRDAAANDLSDAIDADRVAAGNPSDPVPMPVVIVDQNMLDPKCFTGHLKPTELELLADAGGIPPEHDHRAGARELAFSIADRLQRWGAGGMIRR